MITDKDVFEEMGEEAQVIQRKRNLGLLEKFEYNLVESLDQSQEEIVKCESRPITHIPET